MGAGGEPSGRSLEGKWPLADLEKPKTASRYSSPAPRNMETSQLAEDFKVHLFTYEHEGAMWSFDIPARDERDARARLRKLVTAECNGTLVCRIPYVLGPLAAVLCGLRNAGRALFLRAFAEHSARGKPQF